MEKSFNPYAWLDQSLHTLERAHWYRRPQMITGPPGAVVERDGQALINFASNDYLGLANHPALKQAACNAVKQWGTGSTGSRLLSGHRPLHEQLEMAIARWKQTEAAMVYSSGYLANMGTLAALAGKRDLIVADEYNHSSLKRGAQLSGATVMNYAHCQATALASLLQQHRQQYRRCLIVTDGVFSMDGDLCPLPQWVAIANQYEAMLLVDEAHGTGVLGKTGSGCREHFQLPPGDWIQVGTLSKALGSLGGYVAGSRSLIEFLRNRSPTWIYTTGLSPADTAAALAAIHFIQRDPQRLVSLRRNRQTLARGLQALTNFKVQQLPTASPILWLGLDSAPQAIQLSQQLQQAGFWVPAIRPPTVPTSRLRFSVMATHTPEQIQSLLKALSRE